MNEFSTRNPELAAGLTMEYDTEASKPDVQVPVTRLSSAYHHLSRESSPPSSYSRGSSTQTSPQYWNLSRPSTVSQIMDEDGTLARYPPLPLPSSSQTYAATPEPRNVPLPTEDLSDDERDERDIAVPPTHQHLIDVGESVSSIFSADRAPPFAKAGRSASVSSHSSSPPPAPDPWQSANVTLAPLVTPSILDLSQSDTTQCLPEANLSPKSPSCATSEERIRIPVDEMVRLELERIQLQGLEEAANEDIVSKNTTSSPAIPHGPPPFASTVGIRPSTLSAPSRPTKTTCDSTSSLESIVLAESQTWEKVEGLKDEWQELRNPREEVLTMSESESDIDDDEEEMWRNARAVDELSEDKGFLPSVERRRRQHAHVGNAGTATPKAQRTPKPSIAVSNPATQQQAPSYTPQPRNFFQHHPRSAPIVSVPQSELTPTQKQLVAELQRNRSGRGVPTHHTMRTVSPLFGDW